MSLVDERTQIVRRTVEMGGREQVDPVVAPTEPSVELRDGHQLDYRDSDVPQLGKLAGGGGPRAFRRKGAGVQLVDHLPFDADALPRAIGPLKIPRVDDHRRPMRSFRLKTRRRVRV